MNGSSTLLSRDMIPSRCQEGILLMGTLRQPSPAAQAVLIFLIVVNVLTSPFTALFNALVMFAVKTKSRLRANKTNILLALATTTDVIVGAIIQPIFISLLIKVLLDGTTSDSCLLLFAHKIVLSCLCDASLIHLALISGERYLAMKHTFAHLTIVTESRLLAASTCAWFLSVILHIPVFINNNFAVFIPINNTLIGLSIIFIVLCHVTVYRETRLHEQQIAVQQVTQEAKEQLQNNKKALKLTSIILAALLCCYIPTFVLRIFAVRYRSIISVETKYLVFFFLTTLMSLNSLLNPLIYAVRLRQFRVAFIELTCRSVNMTEAEAIEMRVFGAPNTVATLESGREHEERDQQNVEQTNVTKCNNDLNHLNNNWVGQCVPYRHSI